jgi:hypothetical protein
MGKHPVRWGALLMVCLTLAACQDRREPVKPTVTLAAAASPVVAA